MNKQRILTFLGLGLAVIFAFGSLYLTNWMLDVQEENYLNSTQKIPVANAFEIEEDSVAYKYMKPSDVKSLLEQYIKKDNMYSHEPLEGQLNMSQALRVARDMLERFTDAGIFEEAALAEPYNSTFVNLSNPVVIFNREETSDKTKDTYGKYSYWEIRLVNNYIDAQFFINAESGLIWCLNIYLLDDDSELDQERALEIYLDQTQLSDTFYHEPLVQDDCLWGYESKDLFVYSYMGLYVGAWVGSLENYFDSLLWQHYDEYGSWQEYQLNKIEFGLVSQW